MTCGGLRTDCSLTCNKRKIVVCKNNPSHHCASCPPTQYYSYVTDTRCKRVGTQCWVYGAIMCAEALVCIKFGKDIFARTILLNILAWLLIQFVLSVVCVYCCVLWAKLGPGGGITERELSEGAPFVNSDVETKEKRTREERAGDEDRALAD